MYRANILSPRQTVPLDVTINVGLEGTAWPLTGGFYFYRVSALFAANDASNPGGESLPGDYLSIRFPKNVAALDATLTWPPVAGAVKYRLYRTKTAGDKASLLQVLAEVPAPADPTATVTYKDIGAAPISTGTPMPDGSLGVWHQVGTLPEGTIGASSGTVHVGQSGNTYHWYVMGGQTNFNRKDAGKRTVSMCTVVVTPENGMAREGQAVPSCAPTSTQTPTGFNFGKVSTLTTGADGINIGDKTLIASAGGINFGNAYGAYHAGSASGALQGWATGGKLAVQGHCQFNANGFVYIMGGGTTRDGFQAKTTSLGTFSAVSGNRVSKFNAMGAAKTDRIWAACETFNAYFFMSGGYGLVLNGAGGGSKVQNTIEQVPQ